MAPKRPAGRNDKSAAQSSQSSSRNSRGDTRPQSNNKSSTQRSSSFPRPSTSQQASSQQASTSNRSASSQRMPTSQRATASPRQNASQSMTQADKAAAGIDKTELDHKVNDLVQYLLIAWQKNYPIKKVDINKNVLKEHKSAFGHIMKKAQEKMAMVFGIDVVELQDKNKGSFVLINNLQNDTDNPHLKWSEKDSTRTGLLMVILSMIYMNGNVMQDSELWHSLKKLQIESDVPHPTFGDVKRLITQEFVRQGYLEYIRQANVDPPTFEFRWGQRSFLEISKRSCLSFVSQIYDMEMEKWTSQHKDMLESEGPIENGGGDC